MSYKERDEGRQAYRRGEGIFRNPYGGHDYDSRMSRRDWEDGYRSERFADEERKEEEERREREQWEAVCRRAREEAEEEEARYFRMMEEQMQPDPTPEVSFDGFGGGESGGAGGGGDFGPES